jgi:hypothetical protein
VKESPSLFSPTVMWIAAAAAAAPWLLGIGIAAIVSLVWWALA